VTPPKPVVLLVEDDPIARSVYATTLSRAGFWVVEAMDARTAYRTVCDRPVDLMVVDLRLPDESGAKLAERVHADPDRSHVPIIGVSGVSSTLEHTRALDGGFKELLLKPISPARLLEVVRAYLPNEDRGDLPGQGRSVLVAHADELVRRTMAIRFRRQGYAPMEASDGFQALEMALDKTPDAVIAGAAMERLDGFGLAGALRKERQFADAPIVLFSLSPLKTREVRAARSAGASAYIETNSSGEEVLTLVTRLLETRASGQERARPTSQDIFAALAADEDALRETMPSLMFSDGSMPAGAPDVVRVDDDRTRSRLILQLEHQLRINRELTRITNRQAGQLSVLAGVSETLTRTQDPKAAINAALARCMDVNVFSLGAAFLVSGVGRLSLSAWYGFPQTQLDRLPDLFGYRGLAQQALEEDEILTLPSDRQDLHGATGLLEATGTRAIQLVPLAVGGQRLGLLVLASPDRSLRRRGFAFARTIQGQLAQALLLGHTLDQLAISEQRFRRVTERMAEGLFTSNRRGTITFVNDAARRLLGLPQNATVRLDLTTMLPGIELDAPVWEGTALAWDGSRPTVRVSTSVHATGGEVERTHIVQDVTDARRHEEKLRVLAERDALTGLLNRRSFLERVQSALGADGAGAVLFIDLDGFKEVNDTHGHAAGDGVLETLADALRTRLRRTDVVARIGGDEFAVLQPGANEEAARALGAQILRVVGGMEHTLRGQTVTVGASVGCAVYPRDGAERELLLERADAAMYAAKRAGGNAVVVWKAGEVQPRSQPRGDEPGPDVGHTTGDLPRLELEVDSGGRITSIPDEAVSPEGTEELDERHPPYSARGEFGTHKVPTVLEGVLHSGGDSLTSGESEPADPAPADQEASDD